MEKLLSRLPYTLSRIIDYHNETAWNISEFIRKSSGGKPYPGYWEKHMYMRRTCIDLEIRHDNDYVEIGPHTADPEGKMFHIFTIEEMKIKFPVENYGKVIQFMKNFAEQIDVPEELKHVKTEFYSWQREIEVPSNGPVDALLLKCRFQIYHTRRAL